MKRDDQKLAIHFLAVIAFACLAGCPEAAPITSDTTPPTGSIIINNDDAYAVSATVSLELSASDDNGESGMKMMISNAADFSGADWETYSSTRTWALSGADGQKTVFVKFKDTAENQSAVSSDGILLDATLPGAPGAPDLAAVDDTGVSSTDNITRTTTGLTFSGAGVDEGLTVRLYRASAGSAVLLGSATADALEQWTLDAGIAEGMYNIYARVVAASGNESPSSAPLALAIDATPPTGYPKLLAPAQGANTGTNKRPVFKWTSAAGAAYYELQIDDSPGFGSLSYNWTYMSGMSYMPAADMTASVSVPVGTRYYMRMRGLDAAGNTSGWVPGGTDRRYVNVGRFDTDFNGDGYSDIIVGKYAGDVEAGWAYIFLGGLSMDTTADVTMEGEAEGDNFGMSVASAGDVNGDGYGDAIVGAPSYNGGMGRVYVYFGGVSMDGTADYVKTGAAANYLFGNSVAAAGDTNGDGYSDVIIGAPGYNGSMGLAYVYYGGAPMDTDADVAMFGGAALDRFGASVASAGDVNGDGFADVIVGAYGYTNNRGRAYIFYLSSICNNIADVVMTGEATGALLGQSVASAGDVNGDGYADAIVAASGGGHTYVYFGSSPMDNTADVTMSVYGSSVASAGDMNKDGFADVIVGNPGYDGGHGQALIYLGDSSMNNMVDFTFQAYGGRFGESVASAGDVNRDGYADIIVGAWNWHQCGGAFVFFGASSLNYIADFYVEAENIGDRFGCSVAAVRRFDARKA